jgi:hypothetical protein
MNFLKINCIKVLIKSSQAISCVSKLKLADISGTISVTESFKSCTNVIKLLPSYITHL